MHKFRTFNNSCGERIWHGVCIHAHYKISPRGRHMYARRMLSFLMAALLAAVFAIPAVAQSLVSGDVTGIVSDPSGAIVPKVTITLKNNGTGQTQTTTTNASGVYRVSLVEP